MGGGERDPTSELIKKMVRYALACEYSRTPIRRDGIKEKGTPTTGENMRCQAWRLS
jgi:melanoma-associated antigen